MNVVNQLDDAVVICVNGDLDLVSAPALASLIDLVADAPKQRVVVSLEGCTYCYAAGLSVLALAHKKLGPEFCIVVPDAARSRRIFEISGLSKVLRIFPTVDAALITKAASAA